MLKNFDQSKLQQNIFEQNIFFSCV